MRPNGIVIPTVCQKEANQCRIIFIATGLVIRSALIEIVNVYRLRIVDQVHRIVHVLRASYW